MAGLMTEHSIPVAALNVSPRVVEGAMGPGTRALFQESQQPSADTAKKKTSISGVN